MNVRCRNGAILELSGLCPPAGYRIYECVDLQEGINIKRNLYYSVEGAWGNPLQHKILLTQDIKELYSRDWDIMEII